MKKKIALILSLALLFTSLSACGKKRELNLDLDNLVQYDVTEYLVTDQYAYIQSMVMIDQEIIVLASDATGINKLVRIDSEGKILGEIPLDFLNESVTMDGMYAAGSKLYVTATDYSDPSKMIRMLYTLDQQGQVQTSFPVAENSNDGSDSSYLQTVQISEDGKILLVYNDRILLMDDKGQEVGKYEPDTNQIGWCMRRPDGKILLTQYTETGMTTEEIDLATGQAIKDVGMPAQMMYSTLVSDGTGNYYMNASQYLSKYDVESNQLVKIMSWLDTDLNRNSLSDMLWVAAPDGSFYFGRVDYPEGDGGVIAYKEAIAATAASDMPVEGGEAVNPAFTLIKLTKSADQNIKDKKNIVVGGFYINESMRQAMIQYKKEHTDVRFSIVDYSENMDYSKENSYEDMLTKINADILAGQMPDIMMVDSLPWKQYANKGLLADIGAMLDKSSDFDSSLYLGNVFEAMKEKGKQYTFSTAVYVMGLVGSRETLGDRTGWTLQEFQQQIESLGDAAGIFSMMSGESILSMLLMGNLDAYLDPEKGAANFNTPDFVNLLEFAKKYGVAEGDSIQPDKEIDTYETPALNMAYMMRFDDMANYNAMYDEQAVLLGLPSPQKKGPALVMGQALAVAANSTQMDAVQDFLLYLLSEPVQDTISEYGEGFPLMRSVLDKDALDAIEASKNNQGDIMYKESSGISEPGGPSSRPLNETDTAQMISILSSATSLLSYDEKATALISEETKPFFSGDKTAAETAESIQSRMRAYIGEQ